ncbi:CoA transferase [Cytobacillus sp. FSL R5-0569]|uniref:CaiB/BaiF CoA transferase family protein n=1 Tax=Cytobacillus TaxID=2675230 RepID=UPI002789AC21|nr:CoA transferase [Cytobacillus kochii]MDQ0185882.1 crotonobetainyl-CoA:carnitine CoA-transferase CaiB-like acyl-CoA transferase [Cytobacillus kochii]
MANQKEVLSGVRVLDFTWSVSGSTTARILGTLGAEVIKVEWPKNPDYMRFSMYAEGDKPGLDNGAFFNNLNAGKKSLTLNVKSEQGMEIVHELLKKSDIVLENFSAGVFEKWGLSYKNLEKISPGIIYMSISGLGHTGRNKMYGTWGPTAAGLNGMTYISGLPNTHPAGWGYSVMDVVAGYTGAFSVLTALFHKKRTGEGQSIDISQVESGLHLTGANLLDFTVNQRSSKRPGFPPGNRSITSKEHPENNYRGKVGCPHNIYRCKGEGDNDWCTIAVFSDEEWVSLKKGMGNPEWAMDAKYDTFEGRLSHQDELDRNIEAFTINRNKYEVMELLQKYDISSAAVQMNEDLMEKDPQLKARNLFERLNHSLLGERNFVGIPIKMSETQPYIHKSAPLMGEDNSYVLREVLGLSDEEIKTLDDEGVLWPKDMPKDEFKEVRSLW